MKFWQSLAFVELEQMPELARFCEELGFHGVSYGDHLVTTREQADQYLYQSDGNIFWNPATHWPDPWVITAALAAVTKTLEFMTTVYIVPLRDPYTAAKAISTAACCSQDRVTLGVGVGWQKTEFDLVGQDFHTRGKRTDEALQLIRQLMRGEMTEFHGQHYDSPALQMSPGTHKVVPIMVGGYSDAAMRRATRYDGWMATSHEEQEVYPLIDKLKHIRQQNGNCDQHFDIWTGVKNPTSGTYERLAEAGITMVNGTHFLVDGKVTFSSIDDKKRRLEQFANTHF